MKRFVPTTGSTRSSPQKFASKTLAFRFARSIRQRFAIPRASIVAVKMGWTYNTADPNAPTMGPTITGVAAALTAISLLTVCLRMYVRFSLIKAPGVDDWIIMATWVSV